MSQHLAHLALVVRDYDEAIAWYTRALRFELVEDRPMAPASASCASCRAAARAPTLVLARAANPEQATRIGNQTGGRVFLFLHTDDFAGDHAHMRREGVTFCEEPRHEEYGTVVVFEDLYGNRWDLIEPRRAAG